MCVVDMSCLVYLASLYPSAENSTPVSFGELPFPHFQATCSHVADLSPKNPCEHVAPACPIRTQQLSQEWAHNAVWTKQMELCRSSRDRQRCSLSVVDKELGSRPRVAGGHHSCQRMKPLRGKQAKDGER